MNKLNKFINTLNKCEVSSSSFGYFNSQLDFSPNEEEREAIASSLMARGYFNISFAENRSYDYDGDLTVSYYVCAN